MHTWLEVHTTALIHNLQIFQKLCKNTPVMPVLKSNAYGHGARQVYQAIHPFDPEWIGVNSIKEAFELRSLGHQKKILVMGPIFTAQEVRDAHAQNIDIIIGSHELLHIWTQTPHKPHIHLKVDTGMSRQGFLPHEFTDLLDSLPTTSRAFIRGLATHFADVEDNMDLAWAKIQLERLHRVQAILTTQGIHPLTHSAATSATLVMPDSIMDLARVGIGLYGLWPGSQMPDSPLRTSLMPALTWRAKFTTVKDIPEGSYVGYGCHYKTRRPTTIGVLPVGYYEGYPRLAQSGDVLVQGKRCAVLGRICMNMMMVDLTDLSDRPKPGDIATLIGQDGSETIGAEELAQNAQTIHYEIVTRLSHELPRILTNGPLATQTYPS